MRLRDEKKSELRVAIIGGGIGGAAAAVALKNEGIHAEIYEQAPHLTEIGAGVILSQQSLHLMKNWGLQDEILNRSFHNEYLELLAAADEHTLIKEKIPSIINDPNETGVRSIHRADLLDTLIAPLPSESIHLNHVYESIIEHENHVEVHFNNGTVIEADLVIAANGIHSAIRRKFSDDKLIYSGYHACLNIINREDTLNLSPDNTIALYQDGRSYVLLMPVRSGVHVDLIVPLQDPSWSVTLEKKDYLELFKGSSPKIHQLINNIEFPTVSRALYDREPIERWSSNYITLLGDAAHPMLPMQGQGANMAIQDAGALAEALRESNTIPEALQRYEEERKTITAKYQKLSRGFLEVDVQKVPSNLEFQFNSPN
ncbi:FAD-dependent oxidoreductase [Peribacillus sp. NPDC096379]|uniref:FAD-dependent oxidoreductase n=1 Tax=Peribacillus sp. NPDC096379 TaxID=3364393 RepID=UPI003823BD7A